MQRLQGMPRTWKRDFWCCWYRAGLHCGSLSVATQRCGLDPVCPFMLLQSQKTACSKDSPCQRNIISVLFLFIRQTGLIII